MEVRVIAAGLAANENSSSDNPCILRGVVGHQCFYLETQRSVSSLIIFIF